MMKHDTPLRKFHETFVRQMTSPGERPGPDTHRPGAARGWRESTGEVEYLPYGSSGSPGSPETPETPGSDGESQCEIVASFGEVEAEYAAIRRGAGLLDCPNRGTIIVTGSDRREFLNNMLTQELKDLAPGMVREGFLLNRKGRIEADVRLVEYGEFTLLDVDVHQVESTIALLGEFVFAEDIEIKDAGEAFHHLEIHGPRTLELLGALIEPETCSLDPLQAVSFALGDDAELFIARHDQVGETGVILYTPRSRAEDVWRTLVQADEALSGGKRRIRPIGWYAFNIARIEAGSPLFNIDFGTSNLPHETGVLSLRVSFTKGCYPGQEVVARIENLGRPKRRLIGLKFSEDTLPITGAPVYEETDDGAGKMIGIVTSSTISPMLGSTPIAFAMLTDSKMKEGKGVWVEAEGKTVLAAVQSPRFLPTPASSVTSSEE